MVKRTLINEMGVIGIDHVAVTTESFLETLQEYLALPRSKLLRGPGWNERQKVRYAFVKTAEGVTIEVLGTSENSPIREHAERGGGAYHICYTVKDIDSAVRAINENGGRVVVEPIPDIAFDERLIAFAFHSNIGLFEVVDSLPHLLKHADGGDVLQSIERERSLPLEEPDAYGEPSSEDGLGIEQRLIALMKRELKISDPLAIKQAYLGSVSIWDSLGHIKLAMALETTFGVTIDSGVLYEIRSFSDILMFLEREISSKKETTGA